MDISGIEISEEKLEEWIFNHLSRKEYYDGLADIYEDYGGDPQLVFRQLNIGSYGIIDLITFNSNIDSFIITIYELKKNEINRDSLIQILRYKKGIEEICDQYDILFSPIQCVLVGGCISDYDDFSIAATAIPFLSIFIYNIHPQTGINIDIQDLSFAKIGLSKKKNKLFTCLSLESHDMACKYHNYQKFIRLKNEQANKTRD